MPRHNRKPPKRGATRKPDVTAGRDAVAADRFAERKANVDVGEEAWADYRRQVFAQTGVRLKRQRPWNED